VEKLLYLIVAGLMVVAAAIQFNDPDPIYWVAVYAGTAAVIAGRGFNYFSRFWAAVVIGGVIAGMLVTIGGFAGYIRSGDFGSIFGDMLASKPYVEESREFLGLLLALTALTWCYRRQRKEQL